MAKLPIPKFNLRLPTAAKETLISLILRYKGKRLVYSTGFSIHPKDWDFKTQRPIAQLKRPDLFAIQRHLDTLATYCTTILLENDYGVITVADFKSKLDQLLNKQIPVEQKKKRPEFFEFMEQELAEMKVTHMNHATWKTIKLHVGILKKFQKEKGNFTYEDVDWNFRLRLVDWLTDRNVQLAYGNKTLKILRQLLERARRKKYHSNTDYQGVGWMIVRKRAKGQLITLDVNELAQLAKMNLIGHLAKVRDLCLIGAGTGQRHGDFCRYTPDNFYKTASGIPILSLISNKTDTPTKVPLNIFPWLIPVLERNSYTTPKMAIQNFNNGLKELCELAGFTDRLLKVEQYMGRKARVEKLYVEKHRVISSHCCRRSFATNLYRMGYRISQIMPMTGHSTESQLRQYIGIDNEQNAEAIGLSILHRQEVQNESHSGTLRMIK